MDQILEVGFSWFALAAAVGVFIRGEVLARRDVRKRR